MKQKTGAVTRTKSAAKRKTTAGRTRRKSPGKKIAVLLSGCGVLDGSEIQEAVAVLLAIDEAGSSYQCYAPDIDQLHVMNHITGDVTGETRNVRCESARIARGDVKALSDYDAADHDALFLPGGFGAAKNLSTFAMDGPECKVNAEVERAIRDTHAASKPIGAVCIAPALLARLFRGVKVTIGDDAAASAAIEAMGASHVITAHGQITVDADNKMVTSPCYMLEPSTISQIFEDARLAVHAVLELA